MVGGRGEEEGLPSKIATPSPLLGKQSKTLLATPREAVTCAGSVRRSGAKFLPSVVRAMRLVRTRPAAAHCSAGDGVARVRLALLLLARLAGRGVARGTVGIGELADRVHPASRLKSWEEEGERYILGGYFS
uniref:Uncharacterized protein n=1 Tax=Arundo donax TaxID=35708 RepID=A0A0A8YBG2_ARUDO